MESQEKRNFFIKLLSIQKINVKPYAEGGKYYT